MKLNNYCLITLMVILTIFGVEKLELNRKEALLKQQFYYDRIVNNALADAGTNLKLSLTTSNYSSHLDSEAKVQIVVDSFITSLANTISTNSKAGKKMIEFYIPFIVVGDSNGYYIYTTYNLDDNYQKRILPKIRYCTQFGQDIYFFQGEKIAHLEMLNNELKLIYHSRDYYLNHDCADELKAILVSSNRQEKIATLKRKQLEQDLTYYCNIYNQKLNRLGLHYNFSIDNIASWQTKINQPFILAAVSGLPLIKGQYYSKIVSANHALEYTNDYCGFTENNVKYYVSLNNEKAGSVAIESYFTSAYDAASKGYFPYD